MFDTVASVADDLVLIRSAWSLHNGQNGIRSYEGEPKHAGRRNILVRNGIVLDGDAGDGHVRADGTLFAGRSAQLGPSKIGGLDVR